jgi:hypothetical protein
VRFVDQRRVFRIRAFDEVAGRGCASDVQRDRDDLDP